MNYLGYLTFMPKITHLLFDENLSMEKFCYILSLSECTLISSNFFDNKNVKYYLNAIKSNATCSVILSVRQDQDLTSINEEILFLRDRIKSFCIELKNFNKNEIKNFTFLQNTGISFYYLFLINKESDNLLNSFKIVGEPTLIKIELEKSYNPTNIQELHDKLSDIEKAHDSVVTDKDSYFMNQRHFDCIYYSPDTITIKSNGDVILCPAFEKKEEFKKSPNDIGNLFELGSNRILSRNTQTKMLNVLVGDNRHHDIGRECLKCFCHIKK